uniref:C-type lectin domain-containing protein n=1 Tax=Acrobeloides nanus TaxID=290746 RepID=A0A914D5P1_9BILA
MKPFVIFSLVFLFHIAISCALKCPAVYEFQDKLFHFVDERLTFKEAIGECYKHGGSLAIPDTIELNEFLGYIIAGKKEKQAFWFGGFHIDGTGKKVLFTNGKGANYNSRIGARIDSGLFKTINCLTMDGQQHSKTSVYEWKCDDCNTKKKFICEYEKNRLFSFCPTTTPVPTTTEIPTTTPRSAQTCPPDWVNFSENCYKVLTLKFLR